MSEITTIGLDLAKSVFQVHGIDDAGGIVLRKRFRRRQVVGFFAGLAPCLVGLEACATAHYWERELRAVGHDVRRMPPQYVKAMSSATRTMLPTPRRSARPSATLYALCPGEDGRAAICGADASSAGTAGSTAHHGGQRAS